VVDDHNVIIIATGGGGGTCPVPRRGCARPLRTDRHGHLDRSRRPCRVMVEKEADDLLPNGDTSHDPIA
jgi:hypothetical protein